MSDVNATPAAPIAAPVAAPVAAVPAKPLTALQLIEQEITGFIKQREQAIANVHAVEGAIQGAQVLLSKLRAEEQKAVEFVKSEAAKVVEFAKEKI